MNRQQQRRAGRSIPPQVAANAYTVAQNTVTVTQAMDETLKPLALESQAHEDAVKIITNTLSLYGWAVMALCEKSATVADVKARTTEFTHTLAQALADATTPAQETPMPTKKAHLPPALANLSFVAFLRQQGHEARYDCTSGQVQHGLNAAEFARLGSEWREVIPDEQAAMRQLRAIVRPILQGSVAA